MYVNESPIGHNSEATIISRKGDKRSGEAIQLTGRAGFSGISRLDQDAEGQPARRLGARRQRVDSRDPGRDGRASRTTCGIEATEVGVGQHNACHREVSQTGRPMFSSARCHRPENVRRDEISFCRNPSFGRSSSKPHRIRYLRMLVRPCSTRLHSRNSKSHCPNARKDSGALPKKSWPEQLLEVSDTRQKRVSFRGRNRSVVCFGDDRARREEARAQ